jgi:hypothetical protein
LESEERRCGDLFELTELGSGGLLLAVPNQDRAGLFPQFKHRGPLRAMLLGESRELHFVA